jgi:hypothetical protein
LRRVERQRPKSSTVKAGEGKPSQRLRNFASFS